MGKATTFSLPFLKKVEVAKDTYSFYFDMTKIKFFAKGGSQPKADEHLDQASGWDFTPGQYVRMILPHKSDDRGTSRYFTISSSPQEKKFLIFTIRIFDSSFKRTLHDLKPGNLVQFFGPMGWFILPEHEPLEKVFLAGGIGVTPFHSLLQHLKNEKLKEPITLFISFKKKEEIIFFDDLQKITKKNNKIRVIYTLTQEKGVSDWAGEVGRVTGAMFAKYQIDIQKPVFYVVGSPNMVAGTRDLLFELGIDEERIQVEDFTGY